MFGAPATVSARSSGEQFIYVGFQEGSVKSGSDFGRELLACAVDGTDPDEQPAAPRRRPAAASGHGRRRGRSGPIQMWCARSLIAASTAPWSHQLAAANLAHDGRHVVLSTGTASGKSLAYQLPILTALKANPRARALYLSPTKALGHDQLRAAIALTDAVPALGDVAPSSYDGDSPARCGDSRANDRAGSSPIPT